MFMTLLRRRVGPVTTMLRAMTTQHVDVVGIGDSNQLLSGFGWDHGLQYALSLYCNMYATGLVSAAENAGSGSGQGYGWNFNNGADIGASTGAPAELEQYWNIGAGGSIHRYAYINDAGTYTGNTGLAVAATSPLNVNGALTFRYHYGTFDAGTATEWFAVRRGDSPFTAISNHALSCVTGAYGMTTEDILVPAATRNYPLEACWQAPGNTMQGPCFLTFMHAINTGRSAGFAHSTLYYAGGQSLRAMLSNLQAYADTSLTHYFGIIRTRQAQAAKKIVITINSGLNDRNETLASLGPSPEADGDSPDAYADNLRGIINRIEAVWLLNGWPLSELSFLIMPSHPISTPDDAELVSYRTAAATVAAESARRQALDLSTLTTSTEMLANSWYASAGADTSHLTQAGYEQLGLRVIAALT